MTPSQSSARHAMPDAVSRLGNSVWPSIALSVVALAAVVGLDVFAVDPTRPVGIVFASSLSSDDAMRTIAAAGGTFVRVGHSALTEDTIWVAQGDDDGFVSALRQNGARFVFNPYALGGCLVSTP